MKVPAFGFDSSLESSVDEFSEETFDKLKEGADPEIVTEALSFKDLVLTFLLELRELRKSSSVSCEFVARSISSLSEATNMEKEIEVHILLKEFNAESSQEIRNTCNKIYLHLCYCKKLLRNFLIRIL